MQRRARSRAAGLDGERRPCAPPAPAAPAAATSRRSPAAGASEHPPPRPPPRPLLPLRLLDRRLVRPPPLRWTALRPALTEGAALLLAHPLLVWQGQQTGDGQEPLRQKQGQRRQRRVQAAAAGRARAASDTGTPASPRHRTERSAAALPTSAAAAAWRAPPGEGGAESPLGARCGAGRAGVPWV